MKLRKLVSWVLLTSLLMTGIPGNVYAQVNEAQNTGDLIILPEQTIEEGAPIAVRGEDAAYLLASSSSAEENAFEFDTGSQTITKYKGSEKNVLIPQTIGGVEVRRIGERAFTKGAAKNIESIVLNEGLEEIQKGAFGGCSKLAQAHFPSSLRTIGEMAFAGTALRRAKLNEGLETIGKRAFSNCKSLKTLVLPQSLKGIADLAFEKCALEGELRFGAGLGHVGHKVFDKKNVLLLAIEEGEGEKLYLHDELFPEKQTSLRIPQEREIMLFARAFTNGSDISLDCGEIEIASSDSREEVLAKIDAKVRLTTGFAVIDSGAGGMAGDRYEESGIEWDPDMGALQDGAVISGSFALFTDDKYVPKAPKKEVVEPAMKRLRPYVTVRMQAEQNAWKAEDFTYGWVEKKFLSKNGYYAVTGFSEKGLKKFALNKELVIPARGLMDEGGIVREREIGGIAEKAFAKKGIQALRIEIPTGCQEYIIDNGAFEGNEIKAFEIPEGMKYIEAFAFKNNQIEKLEIPQSMLKVGNESFANNRIGELKISDQVESFQFDSYSFAYNQIREVDLPYSVFKLLSEVFHRNTGLSDRKVLIRTRNKRHLEASTYINPFSEYHRFELIGEEIDREPLAQNIRRVMKLDKTDYTAASWGLLQEKLDRAKEVFSSYDADQSAINLADEELKKAEAGLIFEGVNKKELISNLRRLKALGPMLYTDESYARLQSAIARAEEVQNQGSADQSSVDAANLALLEAEAGLTLKEEAKYNVQDFIFEGNTIKGFSAQGEEKFKYNKDLVLLEFGPGGETITRIGDRAFKYEGEDYIMKTDTGYSPNGLDSLVLPSSLVHIGKEAFRYHKIQSVNLPEGLESIDDLAFNGNLLSSVEIPDSVKNMGVGVFSLNDIRSVKLSRGMKNVPAGILSRNIHLAKVELYEGIESIDEAAFAGCPIGEIEFPSTLKTIKSRAFLSHRIETLVIPPSVEKIEEQAFASNKKFRYLKNIILSEGLKEIGSNAFKSSLVEEVFIPASLEELHTESFNDNMNAKKEIIRTKVYTNYAPHMERFKDRKYEIIFVAIDSESLQAELNHCEELKKGENYLLASEESRRGFDRAWEEARKVLEHPLSQVQVRDSLLALKKAAENLDGLLKKDEKKSEDKQKEQEQTQDQKDQKDQKDQPKDTPLPRREERGSGGSGSSSSGRSAVKKVGHPKESELGAGSWLKTEKGWWYKRPNGSYPKSEWKSRGAQWYYFNEEGYMQTGWLLYSGKWYYMNPREGAEEGKMVKGWILYGDKWYYLNEAPGEAEGSMLKNTRISGWQLLSDGSWDGKPAGQ